MRGRWTRGLGMLVALAGTVVASRGRAEPLVAGAPAPPLVRQTHGLSGSGGFGSDRGGLGFQLRYDLPVRGWLDVAPFAGAGWYPVGQGSNPWAWASGIAVALGYRHRLLLAGAIGPVRGEGLVLHLTSVEWKAVYGPCALIGYEHMSDEGGFLTVTVGYGWALWPRTDAYSPMALIVSVGGGVRLW